VKQDWNETPMSFTYTNWQTGRAQVDMF